MNNNKPSQIDSLIINDIFNYQYFTAVANVCIMMYSLRTTFKLPNYSKLFY